MHYERTDHTASADAAGASPPEIGFLGQDVEAIFPELTAVDADGYRSVNYSRITAVLVEAIKEQHQMIREQAATIAEGVERLARIEVAVADSAGRAA